MYPGSGPPRSPPRNGPPSGPPDAGLSEADKQQAKREQEERLALWPRSAETPPSGGYAGYDQPAVNYSNFVNPPPMPTREDGNAYRSGGQMHMTWTNFGQETPGKEFNSWSSDQQKNYMKPFMPPFCKYPQAPHPPPPTCLSCNKTGCELRKIYDTAKKALAVLCKGCVFDDHKEHAWRLWDGGEKV